MRDFGKLLSVNAGLAAPMEVQGETVVTGFDKRPTGAPGWIEVDGLDGDEHVDDARDPDRAVLLYQRHHYEAWAGELGRELPAGTFGEQLTIDGPAEDDVVIGDVLRVGGALLEVTQPRIPCRKMAVRVGVPDMPVRYLRSGRVGFFCKVLRPGQVRSGDGIELVRRGPDGLTVAELAGVLHRDEPGAAELDRVLAATVLPSLVRAKLTRVRARQDRSWAGDRPLRVGARVPHGTDVVAFDLADPAGERLPDFRAGQFLTLTLEVPGVSRPVVRTYTVAGRSADGLGYRIAVKREAGRASSHLHDTVGVGATISVRAPRGRFTLVPGERPVVLVSAGIGITPMIAMLEELTGRDVLFVHGARSSRELTFGPHVRDLVAAGGPRFRSHLMFSRPQPHDLPGAGFDAAGRLTAAVLERLLPGLDADFYVCGPVPFMADIVSGLLERAVPEDQVHYEFFGATNALFPYAGTGGETVDADGRPILVTFARSGVTVPWRETSYSLLSLAEQAGLRPDASCRAGLCNTCVCRLDDGEVDYVVEPMDPVTPGKVAVCCARPRTSVMIDL